MWTADDTRYKIQNTKYKVEIIFFGSPEFAAIILERLVKNNLKPVLVVTAPDKPVGRKQELTAPATKVMAEKHGIPVLQPDSLENREFLKILSNCHPDIIVLAAFGPPFLTKEILSLPKFGCLNVHPSLLPKYRGASPIPQAILNGEKQTGVTIFRMSEKIDQGDILSQETVAILSTDTTQTLTLKLADLGGYVLAKTIPALTAGKVSPLPQDKSPTPYTFQLKKEHGKINWQNQADFIEKQIRAFTPWPGTYTGFQGKNLKIIKAHVINENRQPLNPGFVFLDKAENLVVQTGKDCLAIEELQLEGGEPMEAREFLRGHRNIIGNILD